MTQYLYPQNLKAKANLWLWGLRDFTILCVAILLSAVVLVHSGILLPAAGQAAMRGALRLLPVASIVNLTCFLPITKQQPSPKHSADMSEMGHAAFFLPHSNTLNGG